jgi:hypothetical protein
MRKKNIEFHEVMQCSRSELVELRKKTTEKLYLINPSFEKFNLEQMFKYGLLANDDKISYLIGVFLINYQPLQMVDCITM